MPSAKLVESLDIDTIEQCLQKMMVKRAEIQ